MTIYETPERMAERAKLESLIRATAEAALAAGIEPNDTATGPLAQWVRANVSYRPSTEFFIVLLTACAMADILAQHEGYRNASHRAAVRAFGPERATSHEQ